MQESNKETSALGNPIPLLEEAIAWCKVHQAVVKFFYVQGYVRVELRAGGYNPLERYSLEECVADVEYYRRLESDDLIPTPYCLLCGRDVEDANCTEECFGEGNDRCEYLCYRIGKIIYQDGRKVSKID